MLKRIYIGIGTGLLVVYGVSALLGWELMSSRKQTIPSSVRNSPGGYRSFHFWHTGYRGGK